MAQAREHSALNVNWLAVAGLTMDLVGVGLLLKADFFSRKSQMLHQASGGTNLVGYYEAAKEEKTYAPSPQEQAATNYDKKSNPKADLRDARSALVLLLTGFALQLVSQFISI